MNTGVTFRQVIDRLQENGFDYAVLALQEGARAVVSGRGGRIFGPFFSENGKCSCWVNGAFAEGDAFERLLARKARWLTATVVALALGLLLLGGLLIAALLTVV